MTSELLKVITLLLGLTFTYMILTLYIKSALKSAIFLMINGTAIASFLAILEGIGMGFFAAMLTTTFLVLMATLTGKLLNKWLFPIRFKQENRHITGFSGRDLDLSQLTQSQRKR